MENLSFETDQQVIDNLEAVTYTSVASTGNATVSITDAAFYWSQDGLVEGAPSAGAYLKAHGRFAIRNSWLEAVGGARPADTIARGDGSVWTVLRARPPMISGVWQLDVVDLILANGLVQTGALQRPSNTARDAAGRQALSSYTTIASGVPCRVQPLGGEAGDLLDRRAIPQRFTAFLGVQLTPQALDVFSVGSTTYTVLDWKLPQRIDELMTLSLELLDNSCGSGGAPSPSTGAGPAISGIPLVGNLLTCSPGAWSQSPTFAYQWLSGGTPIAGATHSTYALQSSDVGNLVVCTVTAASSSGNGQATTSPVGPVVSAEGLTGTFP